MKKLRNAISLIIKNEENKIFVVRRSPTKTSFPNYLSLPAMYQAEEESFKDTANRLAKDKLGLTSIVISDKPIGISNIVDRKENLLQMYDFGVNKFEGDFSLNQDEYSESMWMTPKELLDALSYENDGQMGECTRTLLISEGLLDK